MQMASRDHTGLCGGTARERESEISRGIMRPPLLARSLADDRPNRRASQSVPVLTAPRGLFFGI